MRTAVVLYVSQKMKKLIHRIVSRRLTWFILGLVALPVLKSILSSIPIGDRVSPKDAMGHVSYYNESKSLFTFLGDHSYTLKFPGDRKDFEKFAKKMRMEKYKVSEDLYKIKNDNEEWGEELSFHEDEKLMNIQYTSYSW